jgi:predicted Rossmann fold flavoprotein
MAAYFAANEGSASVFLFEPNTRLGKKLRITGKGRCNLTNAASVREMQDMIPRGNKFLLTALYAFPSEAVCEFFTNLGISLKTERGGRVFPVSDRADEVADALANTVLALPNVKRIKQSVIKIRKENDLFLVATPEKEYSFDCVILATGGVSYPLTGSTGEGHRLARSLGHSIMPLRPALCPLVVRESVCGDLMGLSLKNCALRVFTEKGRCCYEDFGEMLFTHFGVSGPMILSASSYLDFDREKFYHLRLDLKPALSREQLDRRILADFEENINRDLINALDRLLPQKLILPFLQTAQLDPRKKVNAVTREERIRMVSLLKEFPLTATGHRPIEQAIVPSGGISTKEINPRTMESRLVPGLFFAGEIMDVDALTGGFNLQIAFSTGRLAGESALQEAL